MVLANLVHASRMVNEEPQDGLPVAGGHETSPRAENSEKPLETGRSASLARSPARTDGLTLADPLAKNPLSGPSWERLDF
jgi:hypothetical protein